MTQKFTLKISNTSIRKPSRKYLIMEISSIYTKYFLIETASSVEELKVLLMHVVNVGP